MPLVALLAVLLALNLTWLLGFYSFLLGACLYPITLGLWWAGPSGPVPGVLWPWPAPSSSATSAIS